VKGTLDLTPKSCTWEPETTPADPRAPFVISCWEGTGSGVVLRLSYRALEELSGAIERAQEEHRKRLAGKKVAL
jgi:hypothetical protein